MIIMVKKGEVMENMNKNSVNLGRAFLLYISKNKKAWKKIDELYNNNYDKCMDLLDLLDERVRELDLKLEQESIETT